MYNDSEKLIRDVGSTAEVKRATQVKGRLDYLESAAHRLATVVESAEKAFHIVVRDNAPEVAGESSEKERYVELAQILDGIASRIHASTDRLESIVRRSEL